MPGILLSLIVPEYFRDIVFPFQVEFEMDVDDSSRYCAGCSAQTHFLDRCVLEGKVWHRRCLKCSVCKKQLYRGTFCGGNDASRFECVDHLVNQILHADSMVSLNPEVKISNSTQTLVSTRGESSVAQVREGHASSASTASKVHA